MKHLLHTFKLIITDYIKIIKKSPIWVYYATIFAIMVTTMNCSLTHSILLGVLVYFNGFLIISMLSEDNKHA